MMRVWIPTACWTLGALLMAQPFLGGQKQGLVAQPDSLRPVQVDPSTVDLRDLEQQIFRVSNHARTNPASFAAEIQQKIVASYQTKSFRARVRQLWVTPPGESTFGYSIPAESKAYQSDVKEVLRFLKSQTARPALQWSKGLAKAAGSHAQDPNARGHRGGDGSDAFQRMSRYGTGGRAENLGTNHTTAFGFISAFIIDFRVPSRGHRVNLFNPAYTDLGVGCHYFAKADPQALGFIRCVLDFGENYKARGDRR